MLHVYGHIPTLTQAHFNDFDFFLVTKDQETADRDIQRLIDHTLPLYGETVPPVIVRTEYSVTLATSHFKIQIILRLYNSMAQILSGFDLDSSAIGFDGQHVYCMPRFVRMLQRGYNLADPDRQSTTYIYRLFKYLLRGVCIATPGYDKQRITPTFQLLAKPLGLAKLIATYSKFMNNAGHIVDSGIRADLMGQEPNPEVMTEEVDYGSTFPGNTHIRTIMFALRRVAIKYYHEQHPQLTRKESAEALDQGVLGMKWHEFKYAPEPVFNEYQSHDIRRALQDEWEDKNESILARRYAQYLDEQGIESTYRVYETAGELLTGEIAPGSRAFSIRSSVPTNLTYRTRNPGTQTTNSFQPTSEDWFEDLYTIETDPNRYRDDTIARIR
jgi:hypothetical protein